MIPPSLPAQAWSAAGARGPPLPSARTAVATVASVATNGRRRLRRSSASHLNAAPHWSRATTGDRCCGPAGAGRRRSPVSPEGRGGPRAATCPAGRRARGVCQVGTARRLPVPEPEPEPVPRRRAPCGTGDGCARSMAARSPRGRPAIDFIHRPRIGSIAGPSGIVSGRGRCGARHHLARAAARAPAAPSRLAAPAPTAGAARADTEPIQRAPRPAAGYGAFIRPPSRDLDLRGSCRIDI